MNKTHSPLLFIVIAVTLAVSLPAMGRGTASPYLKTLMAHNGAGAQAPLPGAATQAGRSVSPLYTSIVIETESPDTPLPDFVTELARRGELAVVSVPQARLNDLLGAPGVLRMESGVCNTPTMTQARSMCGLEKAYQIPGHFRGRNVVVGFTDIGFDPGHINFTDPATGHSRVKRLVNYTLTSPLPGRLTSENEISAWTTDTDQEWHATHVAGILAGSYAKNNYYGVAPEAEIVATTSLLADGYLLAGCEEIIAYAKEQQKPAVINMSIASSTGSHDGTSLFNRYMERLADDAVVCISSGNSGDKWSAHIPFTATAEKPRIQTAFREYPHSSPFAVSGIADLWSLDDAAFTVTLLVYDSQTRQIAARIPTVDPSAGIDFKVLATTALAPNYNTEPDPTLSAMFASAAVVVSCELNPANNRFNTVVSFIWRNKTEANLTHGRYWLGIEVGAKPGNGVELYASNDIEFMRLGGEFQPEFSVAKSINDLACGHGIVSVGAVSERNMWQTATGGQSAPDAPDNEATVASFSSFGQLNDGRLLPSICAPGCRIISSVSTPYATAHPDHAAYAASVTADGRENFWDYSTGTSMASPYAAGVFALMFEANPELTPAEAIAIVESTATRPLQQKPQWGGAGMLNAYEALKKALDTTGIASITAGGDSPVEITPLSGNRYSIKTYGPALDNITVTDTNGRTILHIAPQTDCAEIDLSHHGPAIYLVTASAHGSTVTKKIAVR